MIDRNGSVFPTYSPAYGGPPYDMVDASMVFVSFTADNAALHAAVPAPLELASGDATAIVSDLVQLPHVGWFFEGSIRIPVRFAEIASEFTPQIWCSEDEAVLVGREVYGMPKIMCDRTRLERAGNQVRGEVRRRGDTVMKVAVNIERRADKGLFAKAGSRLTVRSFASPDPSRPDYREVLYIPLTDFKIEEAWEGRGFVEIHDTPHASPGILRPTSVRTGYYVRGSWSLGAAKSLWSNYQPAAAVSAPSAPPTAALR